MDRHRPVPRSGQQVRTLVDRYRRRHSHLGQLSPIDYEIGWRVALATPTRQFAAFVATS